MPELPEVETVARGLAAVWPGRRFVRVEARRPDLRKPLPKDFAQRLNGQTVQEVGRRAKYLLIRMESGLYLLGHLGMSGSMVISKGRNEPPGPHDHVEFVTDDATMVTYRDPRRFGLMDLTTTPQSHPLLAHLGPEPLGPDFHARALAQALDGKACSIKAALLDQTVVAGLGNIYVSESLFLSGIDPTRAAGSLSKGQSAKLVDAIRAVLERAIAAGGSSLKDHVQPNGELGYFQHSFTVYGREGQACPGCDCDIARTGGIRRIVQSGRSTFLCAKKQR